MSNAILEAALKYAERGWAVFPISKEKNPLTKNGYKDASTDPAVIKEWWRKKPAANVAIATGSISGGLVVVDIDLDKEKDKDGYATLKEWMEASGCFVDSRCAVTGRGGKHLYFISSEPFGCKVDAMKDIDIRGDGGYVVAPPSVHKNGNEYFWDDQGDGEDPIICVQEDSDVEYFLHECFKDERNPNKTPLEIPKEVGTGRRNDMIFKIAASFQSKGMEDAEIMETCRAYNLSKCKPPLDDDELERTVKSALRYEKGTGIKAEEEPKKPKESKKRRLKRGSEIMGKELPDPEVFVGNNDDDVLLVEGTCILSAKPKLGKSWFVLAMCIACAKGIPFLGYKTKKCSTLYLDLETSERIQQKRLKRLLKGEAVPEGFYMDTETDNLDNGFIDQIEYYLQQDPNIGIVVVDVFQIIRSSSKNAKENEYEHSYRDITPLNALADKYHISIILVCHDRKQVSEDDPFENILGSTGLQGAATQMIVMFRKKNKPIHISVKGKNIDCLPELDVEFEDAIWKKVEKTTSDQEQHICEYMESDIRAAAIAMIESGWTNRDGSAFYGSCTEFIQKAASLGKGIIEDNLSVGRFFNKKIGLFAKFDKINLQVVANGTASKRYRISKITIDTIDSTIDDIPEAFE